MPQSAIAIGSRVRIVWPSIRDGLTGTIIAIEGARVYVRIDGERWKGMAPIPCRLEEVRLIHED